MEPITIREYLLKKVEAQVERKVNKLVKLKVEEQVKKKVEKAESQVKAAESQVKAAESQIKAAVLNLHAKGFAIEDIADILSKPLSFVVEVLEKRFDNK